MIHDRDAVAQPLGFVHVVRGQNDRPPGLLEVFDQIPQLATGLRIESGCRLVEEQQLRATDQCAGEREPLLLSA